MMIYKYTLGPLPFTRETLLLPESFTILSGALQNEKFCVWVLLDEKKKSTEAPVVFHMYCTGEPLSNLNALTYIATVQDGPFVGHIFMERL
jgi:hypothetical protein